MPPPALILTDHDQEVEIMKRTCTPDEPRRAVERLWASFEFEARQQARVDAAERADALSDWWLTHWDRHTAVLFDAKAGPFRKCDRNLGHLHETNG